MGLFDKAKDALSGHEDQVDQATDKAGDFANEKTGGKYEDQINQGQERLDGALGGGQDPAAGDPAAGDVPPQQ